MILSPNYKLSLGCFVDMRNGIYPATYHTLIINRRPCDLLLYIQHTEIMNVYSSDFIQTIEQDLYKLRKIYESNKKY
jgi:hypothetical protein